MKSVLWDRGVGGWADDGNTRLLTPALQDSKSILSTPRESYMILSSVSTDQKPGSRADARTPMDDKESSYRSTADLKDAAARNLLKKPGQMLVTQLLHFPG